MTSFVRIVITDLRLWWPIYDYDVCCRLWKTFFWMSEM